MAIEFRTNRDSVRTRYVVSSMRGVATILQDSQLAAQAMLTRPPAAGEACQKGYSWQGVCSIPQASVRRVITTRLTGRVDQP